MGYLNDGPCLKLTSSFFKDKKFSDSLAEVFENKNKTNKNKIRQNLFLVFITITVRTFSKFYFPKLKI